MRRKVKLQQRNKIEKELDNIIKIIEEKRTTDMKYEEKIEDELMFKKYATIINETVMAV